MGELMVNHVKPLKLLTVGSWAREAVTGDQFRDPLTMVRCPGEALRTGGRDELLGYRQNLPGEGARAATS